MPKTKEKAAQKTKKKSTPQKAEKKSPAKAKETQEQERRTKHVEGIKKTLLSSLLGIVGGVFSYYLPAYGILILLVVVYAQRLVLPRVKIDTKEFRFTDWFFLVFMTFAFWFVSWTILLNKPA
jgi:cation transport ATPase